MQRAIWQGSISFGLVQIPVGLFGAEDRDELNFDLLDRRDMSPVGYQRINKTTGEPVAWDDIVKGYEYEGGRYVTVDKQDFERANVKATRTIDIVHFTDPAALDTLYFEKPYYILPDERGAKPYVLLREALRRQNKIGIARVVIRTREHLAAVLVHGDVLVLELLRWPSELVPDTELELPHDGARAVSAAELRLAERLIVETTEPFAPEAFHDTYREDLLRLIHRKIEEGDKIYAEPLPAPDDPTEVVDIMVLLRRSLGQAPDARAPKAAALPAPRRTATKTTAKRPSNRAVKAAAKKPAKKPAARKPAAARKQASRGAARKAG